MKHAPCALCGGYHADDAIDDDDDEVEELAVVAIAQERELVAAGKIERPRWLSWAVKADGLLVETDRARYFVNREDEEGMTRLASLIRVEFVAGVAGSC